LWQPEKLWTSENSEKSKFRRLSSHQCDGEKILIPGLWDMHVHLSKAGENTLPLFVANGITNVRDMGGDYIQLLKWRKEAADGTRLSPRIKPPGRLLLFI